jgi:hypothetical protein
LRAPKTRLLREDAADASPMTRGRLQKLLPETQSVERARDITPGASNSSISLVKSASDRVRR